MPGPTPLIADYRISMQYTCQGFQHKTRFFVGVSPSADPSGYDLVQTHSGANVPTTSAVTQFFTRLAPFYDPSWASFDGFLLEHRTGTTWNYLASGTTGVSPAATQPFEAANQLALTGKDSTNKNAPTYLYEGAFGRAFKGNSPGALGTALRALTNDVWNIDGTASANGAWHYKLSRGGNYMQRWLADVIDTNEKLRRVRRIK